MPEHNEDSYALQPLLTPVFGASMSRLIAQLANAQAGERVIILEPERGDGGVRRPAWAPTGWAAGEDLAGYDTGDTGPDPLPLIDFLAWTDAATAAAELQAGWDVLIGFPPQGGPQKEDPLGGFLRVIARMARAKARAFLLISQGLLSARSPQAVRQALLDAGAIRTLAVAPAGHRQIMQGLPISTNVGLVHLASLREPDYDSGRRRPATRVVRIPYGFSERSSFEVELPADAPWSFEALDPERAQQIDRWASRSNAVLLEEIAQLPRGSDPPHGSKLLHPRQITELGIDPQLEVDDSPGELRGRRHPVVVLQPGDLVARTIGEPHWTLITEEDLEGVLVAQKNKVTVIRPTAVTPRYLLSFLTSTAAARQLETLVAGSVIPRVPPTALRSLRVPMLEVTEDSLADRDPVRDFRMLSSRLGAELDERYRTAWDETSADRVSSALREATSDAAMASELLSQVTDPLTRARAFMPHPLARIIRVYQNLKKTGGHDPEVHARLLLFGETSVILLGTIGLAYCANYRNLGLDDEWTDRFPRGIALGTWLRAANASAEQARRTKDSLGGLATALSTNSPLNKTLDAFVAARNDVMHGAGPHSPIEYQMRISELEELLNDAVEQLAPLARSEWFVAERLTWSSRSKRFAAFGRSLKGDHPDFETWAEERTEPLDDSVIHMRLGGVELSLGGFCLLRACEQCLHEELYYPDKLRGSMVRLRSLDRGHQNEVPFDTTGLPPGLMDSDASAATRSGS